MSNVPDDTPDDTPAQPPPPRTPPAPPPIPDLPDPVKALNEFDKALKMLAEEEKKLRDELATKDPLEETEDTEGFARELLLVVRAIAKIKQERSATLRRLVGSF